jgi:ATP-dependent DNA helicase RecQ
MVFADRTLIEMARLRPASSADLKSIHGVGHAKLERHGNAFLDAIRSFGD